MQGAHLFVHSLLWHIEARAQNKMRFPYGFVLFSYPLDESSGISLEHLWTPLVIGPVLVELRKITRYGVRGKDMAARLTVGLISIC